MSMTETVPIISSPSPELIHRARHAELHIPSIEINEHVWGLLQGSCYPELKLNDDSLALGAIEAQIHHPIKIRSRRVMSRIFGKEARGFDIDYEHILDRSLLYFSAEPDSSYTQPIPIYNKILWLGILTADRFLDSGKQTNRTLNRTRRQQRSLAKQYAMRHPILSEA